MWKYFYISLNLFTLTWVNSPGDQSSMETEAPDPQSDFLSHAADGSVLWCLKERKYININNEHGTKFEYQYHN